MKFICCQLVTSMLMSPAWSLNMVSHRWEVWLVSTWPCGSAIWNVWKDQLFFSTDFPQPIMVADSFQNYCMTSHLCNLECLKRSTLFSLQIFTCPSQWQTASKITAQLHISAVWNVWKDQLCSPYRFVPVHHSDRRLPKLLHDFTALQFGMFEKINFFTSYRFPHVHRSDSKLVFCTQSTSMVISGWHSDRQLPKLSIRSFFSANISVNRTT